MKIVLIIIVLSINNVDIAYYRYYAAMDLSSASALILTNVKDLFSSL